MPIEIKIPELGESITEVQIGEWLVKEGDTVTRDQNLVSIESEKATVEVAASAAGKLLKITKPNGEAAKVGEVIGEIESVDASAEQKKTSPTLRGETKPASDQPKPPLRKARTSTPNDAKETQPKESPPESDAKPDEKAAEPAPEPPREKSPLAPAEPPVAAPQTSDDRGDQIRRMTPLRRTIAKRLVEAQHSMAILSTFNEVDMSAVMNLRKQHQEAFQARHSVKLGFMSFFVKAVIEALKLAPQLNAEIRGDDIVFHRYYDIGVAIGAGKGLVVPPLRHAERMSFAEVEKTIADLAKRAQDNKLKPEELEGGTFTITNGGVYGSMLSTPIINPPQSGILGLHAIQERPVARDGQVVIRPMMFVALSYDHRLVDGREAVTFLKHIKDIIEDPARLMLEI